MKVEIYTSPRCPGCVEVKRYLDELAVPYQEYDAIEHIETMMSRVPPGTRRTVPQVFVGDKYVGGPAAVKAYFNGK